MLDQSPSLSRLSTHSRILVAETDDRTMKSLLHSLQSNKLDLDVDLCASCDAALHRLHRHPYGLVISSVDLAAMNGFELAKRIGSDIPLILTTHSAAKRTAVEALERGAFDVIPTPINSDDVDRTIRLGLWYRMLSATKAAREKAQEHYRRHMTTYPADTNTRRSFMKVLSTLNNSMSACRRSINAIEMSSVYLDDLSRVLSKQVREQALKRLNDLGQ